MPLFLKQGLHILYCFSMHICMSMISLVYPVPLLAIWLYSRDFSTCDRHLLKRIIEPVAKIHLKETHLQFSVYIFSFNVVILKALITQTCLSLEAMRMHIVLFFHIYRLCDQSVLFSYTSIPFDASVLIC